jgi:hypothetical protein
MSRQVVLAQNLAHWQRQLALMTERRRVEQFRGCAEIQDEMIANYLKWIAQAKAELSPALEAAE